VGGRVLGRLGDHCQKLVSTRLICAQLCLTTFHIFRLCSRVSDESRLVWRCTTPALPHRTTTLCASAGWPHRFSHTLAYAACGEQHGQPFHGVNRPRACLPAAPAPRCLRAVLRLVRFARIQRRRRGREQQTRRQARNPLPSVLSQRGICLVLKLCLYPAGWRAGCVLFWIRRGRRLALFPNARSPCTPHHTIRAAMTRIDLNLTLAGRRRRTWATMPLPAACTTWASLPPPCAACLCLGNSDVGG